jgi:hypothetical protein
MSLGLSLPTPVVSALNSYSPMIYVCGALCMCCLQPTMPALQAAELYSFMIGAPAGPFCYSAASGSGLCTQATGKGTHSGCALHCNAIQRRRHPFGCQRLLFKFHPSGEKCPGSGTEIIPGKHSDTGIKPLALTNGHGRCITVTAERTLASVGGISVSNMAVKFLSVSLPKPPTAVSELKLPPGSRSGFKNPLGLLESSRHNSFSRRRRWAWL